MTRHTFDPLPYPGVDHLMCKFRARAAGWTIYYPTGSDSSKIPFSSVLK